MAKQSYRKTGDVRDTPQRYIQGHHGRGKTKPGPLYVVQDCGYTTACWVWQRKITHGYAYTTDNGKTARASRVFYERDVGPIPDGFTIDHLCRNRACVNPDHLEAVPLVVNVRRKPATKLTEQAVREIRALAGTVTQSELATKYGVDQSSISNAVRGKTWR